MYEAHGYAAQSSTTPLTPFTFVRRELRANDLLLEILYCGVCHSDLHTARGDWDGIVYADGTLFPAVPGHEIVGGVKAVGTDVSRIKVDDFAAVGTMVDSCRTCAKCLMGLEQFCEYGATWTYGAPDRISGENTYGGYSDLIVVRQEFALRVRHPEAQLAAVAPLLCAGITMWSPLRHWNAGPGKRVGIVGIGGLGHLGIKLAHALGAEVIAFTTSEEKRYDAFALGADEVVLSNNADEMKRQAGGLDLIVNCVAVAHDLDPYLGLLGLNGTMVLVGVPAQPHPAPSATNLIFGRRSLAGSLVGGIPETQELLDFSAQHSILADVETIPIDQIEVAFSRMQRSDVKYRFVIDMQLLRSPK